MEDFELQSMRVIAEMLDNLIKREEEKRKKKEPEKFREQMKKMETKIEKIL